MSNSIRILLVSSLTCFVACGGGGDGKSSQPSSSVTNISSPVTSVVSISSANSSVSAPTVSSTATSASTVSSTTTSVSTSAASSPSSSSAGAVVGTVQVDGNITAYDVNGAVTELDADQVKIQMHLLGKNDASLHSATPIAVNYGDDDSLRFGADLTGSDYQAVAITISYPGYTSFSRKLDAKQRVYLDAKLQAVAVKTVTIDESVSISGASVEGFNIRVGADEDEQQSDSMQIQIPRSLLPEGTQSLDVAVRTFDPNDSEDRQFFPGAYADSEGNQLVSVAFNFAEINTNGGEPLMKAMRKARQQKVVNAGGAHKVSADEPVIINRQIPPDSCRLLEDLGDSAATASGFQVPVYTYNSGSGVWDLLGHGTIYNEQGEMVSEAQQNFDCSVQNFYLEILVTNEIFLSDWWNLDYPLTFSQPVSYCARVQLKNSEGQVLSGISGLVTDDEGSTDFASTYFVTDAQGIADIRIDQSSTAAQATMLFYNDGEFGYVEKSIDISPNCDTPSLQVVELARPSMCTVSGSLLLENGSPMNRELVFAHRVSEEFTDGFDYVYTDQQGKYRLNLPCGGHYQLAALTSFWKQDEGDYTYFHIDGSVEQSEQSDDGKSVILKAISLDFVEPLVFGYFNAETSELTLNFLVRYGALPLDYSVTIASADGKTNYGTLTGKASPISNGEDEEYGFFALGESRLTVQLPDQPASGYVLTLNITDGFGKNWPAVRTPIIYTDRDTVSAL